MNDAGDELVAIEADIRRAAQALMRQQRPDGHWVFELEADATIPASISASRTIRNSNARSASTFAASRAGMAAGRCSMAVRSISARR